jgi:hypothetical protein
MTRLAQSGMTAHELMAISGRKTLSQIALYTEKAHRKKLANAGMAKGLRGRSERERRYYKPRCPLLQTKP